MTIRRSPGCNCCESSDCNLFEVETKTELLAISTGTYGRKLGDLTGRDWRFRINAAFTTPTVGQEFTLSWVDGASLEATLDFEIITNPFNPFFNVAGGPIFKLTYTTPEDNWSFYPQGGDIQGFQNIDIANCNNHITIYKDLADIDQHDLYDLQHYHRAARPIYFDGLPADCELWIDGDLSDLSIFSIDADLQEPLGESGPCVPKYPCEAQSLKRLHSAWNVTAATCNLGSLLGRIESAFTYPDLGYAGSENDLNSDGYEWTFRWESASQIHRRNCGCETIGHIGRFDLERLNYRAAHPLLIRRDTTDNSKVIIAPTAWEAESPIRQYTMIATVSEANSTEFHVDVELSLEFTNGDAGTVAFTGSTTNFGGDDYFHVGDFTQILRISYFAGLDAAVVANTKMHITAIIDGLTVSQTPTLESGGCVLNYRKTVTKWVGTPPTLSFTSADLLTDSSSTYEVLVKVGWENEAISGTTWSADQVKEDDTLTASSVAFTLTPVDDFGDDGVYARTA